MAKKTIKEKELKKVYIRTYTKNDGTQLVLRSDKVKFIDMSPARVREKYKIPYLREVKETVEYVEG